MSLVPAGPQLEILLDKLCVALAEEGHAIIDEALPHPLASVLRDEAVQLTSKNLINAGTGRSQGHHLNKQIRADLISWLEPATAAGGFYLELMEILRQGINRKLYLGLFAYECHYSRYEPGAFYKKHLDAFGGTRNRVLSTIFYLNQTWTSASKGELILYAPNGERVIASVAPEFNRMVVFMSEQFPHEVLTTTQQRLSIAGWFRINAASSGT